MFLRLKKIFYLLIISQFIFFAAQAESVKEIKVYAVPMNYDKGAVSFGEIFTRLAYLPPAEPLAAGNTSQYLAELVSFKGQALENRYFTFYLSAMPAVPLAGDKPAGFIILEKTSQLVVLPYHKDGKTINIYNSAKKLILTKDVGYLADLCGDGICQDQESYVDCPKDCPAAGKDDYCNPRESVNDPDCPDYNKPSGVNNLAKTGSIFSSKLFYIISFGLLLAVILVFYYIYKKRRNNLL